MAKKQQTGEEKKKFRHLSLVVCQNISQNVGSSFKDGSLFEVWNTLESSPADDESELHPDFPPIPDAYLFRYAYTEVKASLESVIVHPDDLDSDDDSDDPRYRLSRWLSKGFNHTVHDDVYTRYIYRLCWVIEVEDLAHLSKIIKRFGPAVIEQPRWTDEIPDLLPRILIQK